ncbi:DUF192 domain-containing protein [Phaeobacter sp. B1627]|uniref:DUF192 domain-containing protein n=1 Tax=Phaeobacter sp. B1627 TaxID=2583809 RepID=UPI002102ECA0|nr:DUF192 domain-containing protein [Phaeobacter sp. B1627]
MQVGSVAGAVLLWLSAVSVQAACQRDQVDLRGPWGEARFGVEVVDTPGGRAMGLMYRAEMPARDGMLFVYEHPQRVAFWMKNTLIPLDMIFVEADGTVSHIHQNAVPGDLTPIPGGDKVLVVLEVNAGIVETYGITVGSQMRHEVFLQERAIWPC